MDLLSGLPISPLIFLLIGVVFLLLIVEVIYLIHKRKKAGTVSIPQPLPVSDQPASSPVQNFVVPPTSTSTQGVPWKILLPIAGFAIISLGVLGGVVFLQQSGSRQDIRSRAVDGIDISWKNNCSNNPQGDISSPSDPRCKGSTAWVEVTFTNNTDTEKSVSGRKQQFKCNTGHEGITECGGGDYHVVDENFSVLVAAHGTQNIKVEQSSPENNCGSAQVDYHIDGVVYWGFAWTGNDCSQPSATPTPTVRLSNTPTPTPTLTPTITPTIIVSLTPTLTPPGPSLTPIPGACVNLKFYAVDGDNLFSSELTITDLKDLKPGEKVNVTVLGDTQTTTAKLSVNDSQWKTLPQMRVSPTSATLKEYYDGSNLFDIANYPTKSSFVFLGEVN